MDTVSDNPLKRFSSFWLGLFLIVAFSVLSLLSVFYLGGEDKDAVYEAAAKERHATLAEMEASQAAVFRVKPKDVFSRVGKDLLSVEPGAVRDNAQIVPGSARSIALENAPKQEAPKIEENDPNMPIPPEVMETGKMAFLLCSACHGQNGEGMTGLAPPLDGSEWVAGPVQNLIFIQLRGLTGPIHVKGTKYEYAAPMVAQAFQTDEQVAAVLTFVRNSWSNKGPLVTPNQVEMARGEVGRPPLTVQELLPPTEDHPDFK